MLSKGPKFWRLAILDCGEKSVETNNVTLSKGEFQSSSSWVYTSVLLFQELPSVPFLISGLIQDWTDACNCSTDFFPSGKEILQIRLIQFVNAL